MIKAGKIINVLLGATNMATALIPRSSDEKSTVVLGQYVMLGPDETSNRLILGRIVEIQPDFGEAGGNYKDAVRDAINGNMEIDDHYKIQLNHLLYQCKLLGVCHIDGDNIEFFSDVRHFPPVNELNVFIPSAKVMTSLMKSAVKSKGDESVIEFHIGDLAYGSDPSNTSLYSGKDSVPVYFNVKNILRRRTGLFGKSGYGKSNNVKSIVGMLAKATKNVGQLLIDTNSEYSLDNSQNSGFLDIFLDAGMPEKVVMFTNRNLPDTVKEKFKKNIQALKIDAFQEPGTVFAMVAESVRRQIKNDELPKYLVKWVNGAEADDSKSAWDGSTKKGTIRSMYYAALFNENIKPAREDQKCEVGTTLDSEFIEFLLTGVNPPELSETVVRTEDKGTENKLKDEFKIIRNNNRYFTNHISTMAAFGKWFAEVRADQDNELRDYKDLVITKSYRLSSIKKLHIGNAKESNGYSLSHSDLAPIWWTRNFVV
jgi:hypothetical protein